MLPPDQTRLRLLEQENHALKAEVERLDHNYRAALNTLLSLSTTTLAHSSSTNRRVVEENIKYLQELLDKE